MRAHALRHILLKALAFGVIAVMLTGVCAAQKVKAENVNSQDEFDKLPFYVFISDRDSLKELALQYERLGKKFRKENVSILKSELYRAEIFLKLGDYKKVEKIASGIFKKSDLSDETYVSKISARFILTDSYLAQGDFLKALDNVKLLDTLYRGFSNNMCGQGADASSVSKSYYYARCYAGLGDTSSAIQWIFKSIFIDGGDRIVDRDSSGKNLYESNSMMMLNFLLSMLSPDYNKVVLKEEFENSLKSMKEKNSLNLTWLGVNVPLSEVIKYRKGNSPAEVTERIKSTYLYYWLNN